MVTHALDEALPLGEVLPVGQAAQVATFGTPFFSSSMALCACWKSSSDRLKSQTCTSENCHSLVSAKLIPNAQLPEPPEFDAVVTPSTIE